ncbi:hypothetical protein [Conexibacter woesei]|uniref:hypothetical protein n=1 Tax=Conexibacter woesei TaxID=191495 RepID=UPI0002F53754|nr:hypothetical protein [Conexibacter woesei]
MERPIAQVIHAGCPAQGDFETVRRRDRRAGGRAAASLLGSAGELGTLRES